MQRELRFNEPEPANHHVRKLLLGTLGGVLYIVAALAVMQLAFLLWSRTW